MDAFDRSSAASPILDQRVVKRVDIDVDSRGNYRRAEIAEIELALGVAEQVVDDDWLGTKYEYDARRVSAAAQTV